MNWIVNQCRWCQRVAIQDRCSSYEQSTACFGFAIWQKTRSNVERAVLKERNLKLDCSISSELSFHMFLATFCAKSIPNIPSVIGYFTWFIFYRPANGKTSGETATAVGWGQISARTMFDPNERTVFHKSLRTRQAPSRHLEFALWRCHQQDQFSFSKMARIFRDEECSALAWSSLAASKVIHSALVCAHAHPFFILLIRCLKRSKTGQMWSRIGSLDSDHDSPMVWRRSRMSSFGLILFRNQCGRAGGL